MYIPYMYNTQQNISPYFQPQLLPWEAGQEPCVDMWAGVLCGCHRLQEAVRAMCPLCFNVSHRSTKTVWHHIYVHA